MIEQTGCILYIYIKKQTGGGIIRVALKHSAVLSGCPCVFEGLRLRLWANMTKALTDVCVTAAFMDGFISRPVTGWAKGPSRKEDLCLAVTPRGFESRKAQLLQSHPSAAVTHLHLDEESGRTPHGINHVTWGELLSLQWGTCSGEWEWILHEVWFR